MRMKWLLMSVVFVSPMLLATGCATSDDLEAYATKDELSAYATKADMEALRSDLILFLVHSSKTITLLRKLTK